MFIWFARVLSHHLQVYLDRAQFCQQHAAPAAATHWAELPSHASHVGLIADVTGELACELQLHEAGRPSHYGAEEAGEYRDWLVYDVIPFVQSRESMLWMQGLASLTGDDDARIRAANTLAQFGGRFTARNPDQRALAALLAPTASLTPSVEDSVSTLMGRVDSAADGEAAIAVLEQALAQYVKDTSRCRAGCLRAYQLSRPLSQHSSLRSLKTLESTLRCVFAAALPRTDGCAGAGQSACGPSATRAWRTFWRVCAGRMRVPVTHWPPATLRVS